MATALKVYMQRHTSQARNVLREIKPKIVFPVIVGIFFFPGIGLICQYLPVSARARSM